jgi:hypothetical protein
MVEVSNKNLALVSIGIGVMGVLVSIATGGGVFSLIGGALAGLGAIGAAIFLKMGYLVVPMITQKTKTIVVTDTGYEIPPAQDTIVKKAQNGVYYASAFLGMKIYQSALEREEGEMVAYNKQFEMAMTQFKKVVKISYAMHAVDISNDRKKLETQKAEGQLKLQKEREKSEPDVLRINQFERQIAYFEGMINQLSKGLRPMKVVLYAMVTDTGITKDEAIARVKNAADKLGTLLSNSFNCETDLLTGDEMLKAFEWEKFLPTTIEELEDQTESEKAGANV